MNTLPYEIKEYIMDYIFDISRKTQKAKIAQISKINDMVLLDKSFYNTFISYIKHQYNTTNINEFINKRYDLCIICHSDKELYLSNRFCKKCLPKLNLITLTDAKTNYFLTTDDLDDLECVIKSNPYRKNMIMTLYMECDVKLHAISKHTELGLVNLLNKKTQRINVRSENKQLREDRKMEIINRFYTYSIGLINDILDDEDVIKYISKGIPKPQKRKDILFESIETRLATLKLEREERKRQWNEANCIRIEQSSELQKLNLQDDYITCDDNCINRVSKKCINQKCGKHCTTGCAFHRNL